MPKGSDEKFVSKINQIFDENTTTKSVFYQRNHKSPLLFTIRHFAGDVHYNAKDFLEKNRDTLAESLLQLVQRSTVLQSLTNSLNNSANTNGKKAAPYGAANDHKRF